jgi:hypothetical protein
MERNDFGRINMDGEDIYLTPDNVEVYNHNPKLVDALGSLATRDHIFFVWPDKENPEKNKGAYIWAHHPSYQELATKAVENDAPVHLKLRKVGDTDNASFMRHQMSDLQDTFPEDWLDSPD